MNHRFRTLGAVLVSITFLGGVCSADVVHLKSGGRLEGVVVRETPSSITLEVGMGEVSVPRANVVRIERKESAVSEYRARLAALVPGDFKGLIEVARFAGENNLRSEARLMWLRVLAVDPRNLEAHLALGHVLVGGTFVDEAEAWRARGYVYYEGRWMTPAEQDYLLHERGRRAEEERRISEERRTARAEEDRERRAEAAAERERARAEETSGFPVWGYGGGTILVGSPGWGGYTAGCVGVGCYVVPPIYPSHRPRPIPAPTVGPPRPQAPRSIH